MSTHARIATTIHRVGQKMTLLVFEFRPLLGALYLQFLFTRGSFSLNDVVLRLPMQTSSVAN